MSQRPTPFHQLAKSSVGQMQALMKVHIFMSILVPIMVTAARFLTRKRMTRGTMLQKMPTPAKMGIKTALAVSG